MNILFTGCSTGFGKYVRERLQYQGHTVCGIGINGPDHHMDFLDDNLEFSLCIKKILQDNGPFDILINNAGLTKIDFLKDHTVSDFRDVIEVDLIKPYMLTKYWFEDIYMRKLEDTFRGKVIYTISTGIKMALRASPGYCAAKAGLEAMSRVFAKEWSGKYHLMTACIAPGGVGNTAMTDIVENELQRTRNMSPEEAHKYNTSVMGRYMTHEEVWKIFDFVVNDLPEYCSGTTIYAPGGSGIAI